MPEPQHLDDLLAEWEYDPSALSVRLVDGSDGRQVIQMRIELGILQLEGAGRPDGSQPEGAQTYFDYLLQQEMVAGEGFQLSEDHCFECDREFVQFYHRRICWLALQQYDKAVEDADHTLALMDFCTKFSADENWTASHEQYRPFVMYHRIQANALAKLENEAAEEAVQSINQGLDQMRRLFAQEEIEDRFEEDELVARLVELRESLRTQFEVGRTLQEQLAEAIAQEEYELAARLRDELAARGGKRRRKKRPRS